MNSYLVRAAVFATCLVSPVFAVDQSDGKTEFLISGPLEKVDAALDTVTVFGRDFVTDKASELAVGEIVNVYGSLQKDGSIANPVVEPTAQFGSGDPRTELCCWFDYGIRYRALLLQRSIHVND